MNDAANVASPAEATRAFGSIEDLDARGRRVFLRVDPYFAEHLARDARALSAAPSEPEQRPALAKSTLRQLLELEARVVIGTHFWPEAVAETGLSGVEALGARLSELLEVEVFMPDQCVGDAVTRVIASLRGRQICLLPDLGEARGELEADEAFARALAASADAYVSEAFSALPLGYASIAKLPRLLPRKALGDHARRELESLGDWLSLPRSSWTLWVGGRSFAEKVSVLEPWLPRISRLCVGGQVALTLLAALGRTPVVKGVEVEQLARARSFMQRARDLGVQVSLPVDLRVRVPGEPVSFEISPDQAPSDASVLDVGLETSKQFATVAREAPNVLWWAPVGDVEDSGGAAASRRLVELCSGGEIRAALLGSSLRGFVRQLPVEVQDGIELLVSGANAAKMMIGRRKLQGLEALRGRH